MNRNNNILFINNQKLFMENRNWNFTILQLCESGKMSRFCYHKDIFDYKRLKIDRNIKVIEEYYNTHYEEDVMFMPHLVYKKKLPDEYDSNEYFYFNDNNYTSKDRFLYGLPVSLELFNNLNLEIDSNKYKFLYIRLNTMADFETKEFKENDLVNQLIIDLACKYKIYFSFLNITRVIKDFKSVSEWKMAEFCTEWLICVNANNIDGIYKELNQLKFEEDSKRVIEIKENSSIFFEKKYFLNMDFDKSYISFFDALFISFCYEKELYDYFCLGYYSSKTDFYYLTRKSFINYFLSYIKKNYNLDEEEYLNLLCKEIENYPEYVKDNYVYLPKTN